MFCWKCGEENPEGAKFCRKCGAGLSGTAQSMEDGSLKNETIEAGSSSYNAAATDFDNTTAPVVGTAPGGSKKKLFIGIGIAAAVVLIIVVCVGIGSATRKNIRANVERAMTSEAQQIFSSYANDVKGCCVVISVNGQPVATNKSGTINGIEFVSFHLGINAENFAQSASEIFAKRHVNDCIHDSATIKVGEVYDKYNEFNEFNIGKVLKNVESQMIEAAMCAMEGRDYIDYGLSFICDRDDYDENAQEYYDKNIKSSNTADWKINYTDNAYAKEFNGNKLPDPVNFVASITAKNSLGNSFTENYMGNEKKYSPQNYMGEKQDVSYVSGLPSGILWLEGSSWISKSTDVGTIKYRD